MASRILTDPVVGVAGPGVGRDRVDKRLRGLALARLDPGEARDGVEGGAEVLDALDDGGLVLGRVEIGRLGDDGLERAVDGQAAARGGAGTEVLRQGHGGWQALVNLRNMKGLALGGDTHCSWRPRREPASGGGG